MGGGLSMLHLTNVINNMSQAGDCCRFDRKAKGILNNGIHWLLSTDTIDDIIEKTKPAQQLLRVS